MMRFSEARVLIAAAGIAVYSAAAVAQVDPSSPAGANYARAFTLFGLTGAGVRVGVIEPAGTASPAYNGNPAGFYYTAGFGIGSTQLGARLAGQWNFSNTNPPGPANPPAVNPNAANPASPHTTLVSDLIAGDAGAGGFRGVARGASVYFGGMGAGANDDRTATVWLNQNRNVNIFNFSWGGSVDGYGNNSRAAYYDQLIAARDIFVVKSAGNRGYGFDTISGQNVAAAAQRDNRITQPAELYNGITVGAADSNMTARAYYSSYWSQGDNGTAPDKRAKPEILAPGTLMGDGLTYANGVPRFPFGGQTTPARTSSGTSFAAPEVTGTAALLAQRGLHLANNNGNSGHLLMKAVILNSARKRGISGENAANNVSMDNRASGNQASDDNYLQGGALRQGASNNAPANPTRDWNPSQWTNQVDPLLNRRIFKTNQPLDDEQGVGMLDTARAITQFDAGQGFPVGGNRPIGWDIRNIPFSGTTADYAINAAIPLGAFITATLCWDRPVLTAAGVITPQPIPIFNLNILFRGAVIAISQSRTDALQHLHIPAPFAGNPMDYAIEVQYLSGGSFATQYGLAWWTVPTPSVMNALALAGLLAIRRRRGAPAMPAI